MSDPRWQGCTVPPPGWWCSRKEGHDGPCAARPEEPPHDEPLTAEDHARIDRAWETHKAAGPASVDTDRMAETGTGSGRSLGSAVPATPGDAPKTPPSESPL